MNSQYNIELVQNKELIRLIFFYSKELKGQFKLTKKMIQKILWLTKQEIPDDNPIKHQLGFYWYKEGPYSEIGNEAIRNMTKEELMERIEHDKYEMYKYDPDLLHKKLVIYSPEFEQVKQILHDKINELPKNIELIIRDTYNDSPMSFYPDYKINFLHYFTSYCKHYKNKSIDKKEIKKTREFLYKTQDSLIGHKVFAEFNLIYDKFSKIANIVLDSNTNKNNFEQVIDDMSKIAFRIWEVFALGARILYHDHVYNEQIPKWKEILERETKELEGLITHTENNLKKSGITVKDDIDVFGDTETLLDIVRSAGLDRIPEKDPNAFKRLDSCLASTINDQYSDSVQFIKEVRED